MEININLEHVTSEEKKALLLEVLATIAKAAETRGDRPQITVNIK